ncbi:MAG: gamma-glutamyltransferase family protein [Planctomycetota bacterium]|nr:gamma-glutamyltransferase family protein [Planctomycetota bacterium]
MNISLPLGVALVVLVLIAHVLDAEAAQVAPRRDDGLPKATRPEVYAPRAMAATSHPLATQAALDVMRAGGSAVDGAIAANACLGLMEPTGCGVGGDLFAIVWDPKTQKLHGYNGSGRSPAGVTLDDLTAILAERGLSQIPTDGPLCTTVPGCVDAWFALHEKFGDAPIADVLAPAIRYARDGFPLSPRIAEAWSISHRKFSGKPAFPGYNAVFASRRTDSEHPLPPRVGELHTNPALAATLERLVSHGRDGFYAGEVPATVESHLARVLGRPWLTAHDFAAHRGEWVEPVSANYRGYDVWELPPNGQGIAALQILKVLETFDLRAMGWGSADYVHAFVEAKKLAFEDRARFYADPAFSPSPVARLISAEYAKERAARIDMNTAAPSVEPGAPLAGPDTIYLTVADERGMMVSLIQSNYRGMGSGMVPVRPRDKAAPTPAAPTPAAPTAADALGFMLQSLGEQFALRPDHPNAFAPAKRPFHTIIPAFITKDGTPWISFGLMGGAMQPQGHAQIVINLIDFGMSLQQAGDAPRIHHDGSTEPQGPVRPMADGGVLNLEPGFPAATIEELARRGHTLKPASTPTFGGYQAIRRMPAGVYEGASESRKDGHAAGY